MYQNNNRNPYAQLPEQELAQPLNHNPSPSYPILPPVSNPRPQGYYMPASRSNEQQDTNKEERLAELDEKLEKDFSWFKAWMILTWFFVLYKFVASLLYYGRGRGTIALGVFTMYYLATVIITLIALTKKRMQLATASFTMLVLTILGATIYTGSYIYSWVRRNRYYRYDSSAFLEILFVTLESTFPLLVFIFVILRPINRIRAILAERETLKSH